jgi:hypothetical protein
LCVQLLDFTQRDFNKIKQEKALLECSLLQRQQLLKVRNPLQSIVDLKVLKLICFFVRRLNQDFSVTHQAISQLRKTSGLTLIDNDELEVPSFDTFNDKPIDINCLEMTKSNVIFVLQALPGKHLKEKIILLQRNQSELKEELTRLKRDLRLSQESGVTIRQKLEDKLKIKLNHSEKSPFMKQALQEAEGNAHIGMSWLDSLV